MISCISSALELTLSVWSLGAPFTARVHSKGNHSPHGLYAQSSEIHNLGVKLITELCQLTWTVTPEGYANIGNLYIGKTASLYWTMAQ